jgi:hypothetical protein
MKLSNLKTGMIIQFRDGYMAVIMLNTSLGDIFVSPDNWTKRTWGHLKDFDEEMNYVSSFKHIKSIDTEYHPDIIKVWDTQPELIWGLSQDIAKKTLLFERL